MLLEGLLAGVGIGGLLVGYGGNWDVGRLIVLVRIVVVFGQ